MFPVKDHDKARLVWELAEIARQYHDTQQLRQRIANIVLPALKSPDPHKLWAAAQLAPGECIEDAIARIEALLDAPIRL